MVASEDKKLSFLEDFMLGGAAAVVSKTAAAPLERVKLLIQNQTELMKQGCLDRPYKGLIDCTVHTYKTEGVLPFWRGNLANCIRYFPTQALNFAFKDSIHNHPHLTIQPEDNQIKRLTKNVVSGGIAGGLSLCFVYSLDYARTRLGNDALASAKSSGRKYKGLIDVYMKTLKSDGVFGLYRGFVISCVGIMVYRGAYFGFYDTLKPALLGNDPSFITMFLLGYAITVASETISYPLDTIRRRMMMTSGEAVKYKGSLHCAMHIMKAEGITAFFKGCFANILRGVAGAGVLVGFDACKKYYIQYMYDE